MESKPKDKHKQANETQATANQIIDFLCFCLFPGSCLLWHCFNWIEFCSNKLLKDKWRHIQYFNSSKVQKLTWVALEMEQYDKILFVFISPLGHTASLPLSALMMYSCSCLPSYFWLLNHGLLKESPALNLNEHSFIHYFKIWLLFKVTSTQCGP